LNASRNAGKDAFSFLWIRRGPLKTNPTTRVRVKATCRRRRQRVELHISTSSAAGCMLEVSQRIFAALSCLPVNDNNEERTIPASDDTAHCATLRVLHPSLHPYHRYTIFETVNSAIIVVNVVNIVIIVRRENVRVFVCSLARTVAAMRRLRVCVLYAGQWLGRVHSAAHAPLYACVYTYTKRARRVRGCARCAMRVCVYAFATY